MSPTKTESDGPSTQVTQSIKVESGLVPEEVAQEGCEAGGWGGLFFAWLGDALKDLLELVLV